MTTSCILPFSLLLLCLFCYRLSFVSARSSGLLPAYCDLTPDAIEPDRWPYGRYGGASGIMHWTAPPKPSDQYTITANEDKTGQQPIVGTYTPGVMNDIHIRLVDNLEARFTGLVLYATNGLDAQTRKHRHVGNWTVASTGQYHLPIDCNFTAVTHKGAEIKRPYVKFWWEAPVGTGTVEFRLLIKWGVQGRGAFYYPKVALTLTEGAPRANEPITSIAPTIINYIPEINDTKVIEPIIPQAPTPPADGFIKTVIGDYGESCYHTCARQSATPYCHTQAIRNMNSPSGLLARGPVPCKKPILKSCIYNGHAQLRPDEGEAVTKQT